MPQMILLNQFEKNENYSHKKVDILDKLNLREIFFDFKPDFVMHLAAESHVDNSIKNPSKFIETNIIGTFNLLNISLEYSKE